MHVNAPKPAWFKFDGKFSRFGYLIGAILFHLVLFLMLATLVIWAPLPTFDEAKLVTPTPQAVKVPPSLPPASGAKANNPQLEPQPLTVPPVTPPSILSLASTSAFTIDSSKVLHEALSHAALPVAQGTGLGNGAADQGYNSNYGTSSSQGGGLVGTLYDLKQTPDRKPTDMAENAAELAQEMDTAWISLPSTQNQLRFLRKFIVSWDMNMLNDYYKSPNLLTATRILIPSTWSREAPKAFKCADAVRARRWIVIYHAKVIPPETGRYRFIGAGDDFLVVRIDNVNVLDGSLSTAGESLDSGVNAKENVGLSPLSANPPYQCGSWVSMQAGISVNMSVLIGEGPGGASGFVLMVQKEGDHSANGDYPVFELRDEPITTNFPPSKKKIVFEVGH